MRKQNCIPVRSRVTFTGPDTKIANEPVTFEILTQSSTLIVVVWTESNYTISIIQDALQLNIVDLQLTCTSSTNIPLDSFNETVRENLIELLTIEPVTSVIVNEPINSTLLNEADEIWSQYEPETYLTLEKMSNYTLFAFDATWTLIKSLQQIYSSLNTSSCSTFIGSSPCFYRRFVH
ncbi:unnamed protein product [Adineta ricciae]|uniref:Uncharacterized protein n=1 Tax=Adineta ricciae TaxID=249248 RepID=A0A814I7A7_ADIRI|nr:unnamed protein product [Adineta ricciae]